MVICRDGMTRHNKLTLGLLLPELATVSVFCLPVEHTILLPDYSLAERQSCVAEMFPTIETSEYYMAAGLHQAGAAVNLDTR